jgi:hypothetical protein
VTDDGAPRRLTLAVDIGSDDELGALRGALLAAKATELAEFRRQSTRVAFGYGTESSRETMSDEARRRQLRGAMLDRLLAALDAEASRRR